MVKPSSTGARAARRVQTGRFEKVEGHNRSRALAEAGAQPIPVSAEKVDPAGAQSVLAEARRSGLLEGERSEHVSFRAPPALIEAAKRETGVQSTTELGILALATLAQPDPVVAFMKRTRGRLEKYPRLDV